MGLLPRGSKLLVHTPEIGVNAYKGSKLLVLTPEIGVNAYKYPIGKAYRGKDYKFELPIS